MSGTSPTVAILTFGCRVNQADSQRLERDFRAQGSRLTSPERADVVLVNTCAVTCAAEQAARHAIRRVARRNPGAHVVVTGCYATAAGEDVAALPGVTRVFRNDEKPVVALHVNETREPGRQRDRVAGGPAPAVPGALGRTMCTLRVQTGCDESCSYCVVPFTRGPGRSVPVHEVVREVERATDAGFRELMLTGVHLGSYGRDLVPATTLANLLRQVADLPGDLLVRIGSLEPMDVHPAVEKMLFGSPRFAPHLHLPLQHASRRVLHAMRRSYTLEAYARLVDEIRGRLPDASIGADVIVGFPGEREEDFEMLAAYLSQSPLSYLHFFPYSKRPGTEAAALPNHVPGVLIRSRAAAIQRIGAQLAARFRVSQVGKVRAALTIADGSTVVTDNYLKLRISAGRSRNERVKVRVLGPATAAVLSQ
jgi:threonylcarbamoyladenosine tRNA methylthiotransferase MtaB